MEQSRFSLSWDAHKRNICLGLSSLQQNGEFVDMTLAADGHFVKVHQVIIALASPYIKELISSAQCQHPVIFLNKISYTTLSAILEYIYTGETLVSIDNLTELVEAGKELHIKGLEDMKLQQTLSTRQTSNEENMKMEEEADNEICYFEIASTKDDDNDNRSNYTTNNTILSDITRHDVVEEEENTFTYINQDEIITDIQTDSEKKVFGHKFAASKRISDSSNTSVMQYTVSNQGSLQMILNRFVYYLKHTNRNSTRQWRCVDYLTPSRCPAHVVTRDDVVIQRISAHSHAFHDKRILKKVQAGAIFTAIHEAVEEGQSKKNESMAHREERLSE